MLAPSAKSPFTTKAFAIANAELLQINNSRFQLIDSFIYLLFHMTQLINRNNTKSLHAIRKSTVSEH